jgi:hypothetical protein
MFPIMAVTFVMFTLVMRYFSGAVVMISSLFMTPMPIAVGMSLIIASKFRSRPNPTLN